MHNVRLGIIGMGNIGKFHAANRHGAARGKNAEPVNRGLKAGE
jgi:lactate dehydrogenase-like 2-hydroxyacid dehydrogenase